MMKKIFIICFVGVLFFAGQLGFAGDVGFLSRVRDYVPRPRLLEPSSEEVDLKGESSMLFRWSPHEGFPRGGKYYDFRLYNGRNMVQSHLIFKEKIPGIKNKFHVGRELFEDGAVYTWSMRVLYRGVGKSSRSYHSFTISK